MTETFAGLPIPKLEISAGLGTRLSSKQLRQQEREARGPSKFDKAMSVLTRREQQFVAEYLANGGRVYDAASVAGYKGEGVIWSARKLVQRREIVRAIEARREELVEQIGVSQSEIIAELKRIAFVDKRAFAKWGPQGVEVTPSDELTPDQAAAVSHVRNTPDGPRVDTYSKLEALEKLAKHLGLFERDNEQKRTHEAVRFVMILHGEEEPEIIDTIAVEKIVSETE